MNTSQSLDPEASRRPGLWRAIAVVTLTVSLLVPAGAVHAAATTLPALHPMAVVGDNYPSKYKNAARDSLVDEWNFYNRNCTSFVAWRLNSANGVRFTNQYAGAARWGHAKTWGTVARSRGIAVDSKPAVGSVAWSDKGDYGHVAWVAEVLSGGRIVIEEYNYNWSGAYHKRTVAASSFTGFIHVRDIAPTAPSSSLAQYANKIVKMKSGDTSWFVTPDLKRLWIPDGGTFQQLQARHGGAIRLDNATLDRLPDQKHQWAASGASWMNNMSLRRGMSVKSTDGRFTFAMQSDGNLVLYGPGNRVLWASDRSTSSWRSQEFVIFQSDGNLVTYGGGRAIWASNTAGKGGARFAVQNDGNLVIYTSAGKAVWASNTRG